MRRLTKDERENCIGYKTLLIARDRVGSVARVTSPSALTPWEFDGSTWSLRANIQPEEDNRAGVYVTFSAKEARRYVGSLCKVILSGRVIIGESGARGEFARLLEAESPHENR